MSVAHSASAMSNTPPLPANVVKTMRAMTTAITADLLVGEYDPARETRHNQPIPAPCPACAGAGEIDRTPCLTCGGIGEVMTRNHMAHRMLSAPHGEYGCAGFTLPLVALNATADPAWLANLIERATDATGHALSCEQLLLLFDYLCLWAETYEPRRAYWQLAGKRIMRLISLQLAMALPESEALGSPHG